jgi:hypothetical protein
MIITQKILKQIDNKKYYFANKIDNWQVWFYKFLMTYLASYYQKKIICQHWFKVTTIKIGNIS